MSADDPVAVTLQLEAGADSDEDDLDQRTRQLLAELRELEVESVELVRDGSLPAGAKSAEVLTLGGLALQVMPAIFPKLIEFLQGWAQRGGTRAVKIKTQHGDRSVEVEYSPSTMSVDELNTVVAKLMETMVGQDASR